MKPGFDVDLTEFDKAMNALKLDSSDVKEPLKTGYLVFEGEAKMLIQTSPATGRQYGNHRASAPGEPPASDTGALVTNWPEPEMTIGPKSASIEGGPDQEYARHLEYGTVKMAARPFIRPAAFDNSKKIFQAVRNQMLRKIKAKVK